MTKNRPRGKRWPVLMMTAVSLSALAVSVSERLPIRLVHNASVSAPIGLYRIDHTPLNLGDFVLIEVPPSVRNLLEKRGYLPPGVPLLKHIRALAGDRVCRTGGQILVNGEPVAVALKADSLGRPMPVWQGCRTLGESEIFVLTEHPSSFDSRYFGPVDGELVMGRAVRLTLWPGKDQP